MGQDIIDVHKSQKKCIAKDREAKSEIWQDEGFVFPSTVGSAIDPSNMLRYFRVFLKAANLPKTRFHDLRYTAASLMLNNGVDVLVASQRLGHAQPSITADVYGHLMPPIHNKAAEIIEKIFKRFLEKKK